MVPPRGERKSNRTPLETRIWIRAEDFLKLGIKNPESQKKLSTGSGQIFCEENQARRMDRGRFRIQRPHSGIWMLMTGSPGKDQFPFRLGRSEGCFCAVRRE